MEFRKWLCLLLSCVLFLGLFPAGTVFAEAETESAVPEHIDLSAVEDGGVWQDGFGVSYYVLKTPDKMLSAVKGNASGNYILGADMDMGGKQYNGPLFSNTVFAGIFNGNGYAIRNFTIASNVNANNGIIFHSITGSPKIRNLTVGDLNKHIAVRFTAGSNGSAPASAIGGVIGAMKGTTDRTTVSDITVYADFVYDGTRSDTVALGGMIGLAAPCTIRNCNYYGSVLFTEKAATNNANTMVGGMVGRFNVSQGTLVIRDCHNGADIDIRTRQIGNGTLECAGGIVGSAEYPVDISGCTNDGTIVSDHRSGGIVGNLKPGKTGSDTYLIVNCVNNGSIKVLIDKQNIEQCGKSSNTDLSGALGAGGVIGGIRTSDGSATNATYAVQVTGCVNTADISVEFGEESLKTDSALSIDYGILYKGKAAAGGIIGRAMYGYYTVENCYSTGNLSTPGRYGASASAASGIIGFLCVNNDPVRLSSIRNCFAIGKLSFGGTPLTGFGICVVSTSSASKGYLAELINNYYLFEITEGSVESAVNMTVSESSANNSKKSAEDFASGAVAELLGEAFEQISGNTHPTLKATKPEDPPKEDDELLNLFTGALANGYCDERGRFRTDDAYKTINMLAVAPGTVVTVGALCADQAFFGHLYGNDQKSVGVLTADMMTLTADLGNGYGIYSYTVPATVSYISVTAMARRAYVTLLTANNPFGADEYYEYFSIKAISGNAESPLWRKRALYAGDSISYGYSDTAVNGVIRAWAGRIAYDYDMDYVNVSVSGATVTNLTKNQVLPQIKPYLSQSFDYVILEGGVNDANVSYANAPVGVMTDSKEAGSFDASTYAGALEELFCTVRNAFPDAKVGFIISYRMPRATNIYSNYSNYLKVTYDICEKWGVDCLDLYENEEINNTVLETSETTYVKDGVHPNSEGYDRLSPYISDFMTSMKSQNVPVNPPAPPTGDDDNNPGGNQGGEVPPTPSDSNETPSTGEIPSDTIADHTATDAPSATEPGKTGCRSVLGAGMLPLALILTAVAVLFAEFSRKKSSRIQK